MKTTLLLSALLLTPALPARAEPARPASDIVDTAVAAGRFNTLVAAVKAAGLVEALKGPGPLTVFAPTDEAFAALPKDAVATLLKPENKERLQRVLTYHVVAGRVLAKDLLPVASTATLAGPTLTFGLRVGEANVVAADVLCSNGVIHVIDRVLLPPEVPSMPPAPPAPAVAAARIRSAIAQGVPLFNAGDHAACAAVYERTARDLVERAALSELHGLMMSAALAQHHADAGERAWALRRVFDRVLDDAEFAPRLEAPLPEGFPGPGPLGQVVVKTYPVYRAARADGGGSFWTLFNHIKKNDVQMTAPVEMTMDEGLNAMDMAFLYERPSQGAAGTQGRVEVVDLPALTVLSISMRGDRSEEDVASAKRLLDARIAREGFVRAGPFRMLGYNSPMVPAAQRTWELQVPVARSNP